MTTLLKKVKKCCCMKISLTFSSFKKRTSDQAAMPKKSSAAASASKRKAASSPDAAAPTAKRRPPAPDQPSSDQCWLFKSEPESRIENGVDVKFGIDDLMECPDQISCWDGVRNYQARNFMRDRMKVGELGFFYHSNCKEPGVAGIIRVVKEGYVDHTQFDPKDVHYDPKSKKSDPKWYMVDVQFVRKLDRFVTLKELKALFQEHTAKGGPLAKLSLFCSARLSVQPVTKEEFDFIVELSGKEAR